MTKRLTAIYLDMDGVLVNFSDAALRLYGIETVDGLPATNAVRGWDEMPNVVTNAIGRHVTPKEFWERIGEAGYEFWHGLDWLPWGQEIFTLCESYCPTVLMTTPFDGPSAAAKLAWIKNNMPSSWHKRWALSPCKHHMAHPGALLIDDNEANISKFNQHGGTGFLWPQFWNSKRDEADVDTTRRKGLQDLQDVIEVLL